MTHDPKAQEVITAYIHSRYGADAMAELAAALNVLDALADAGLLVFSDAAEPAMTEHRTRADRLMTEAELDDLAAEAELGYCLSEHVVRRDDGSLRRVRCLLAPDHDARGGHAWLDVSGLSVRWDG